MPFYVPVLEDENEENVIMNLLMKQKRLNRASKNDKESVNNASAFEILLQIADYPFDLFKIRIKSVVNDLINIDILKYVQYMEHRIRSPSMLPKLNLAKVQSDAI